ncbi:MAG: Epimerase protein [Candidatus Magasanikbacteria bacterium]|nr:Epimerase protein [Candidatus Magasanikbacteria bacterium]
MLYVVTGGAGFIGTNIAHTLLAQGHTVRVVDNFSTGKRERLHPQAELFEIDVRDYNALMKAFSGADGVFHTAALARMPLSVEKPIETNDVNVGGTVTVLKAAVDAGVKRVVYSASSSAYGLQDQLPYVETMTPRPMSPYGLQKLVNEEYCRLFHELYGLETVSLRYFNVYGGKWQSADGAYPLVIALFLKQKKEGAPLTICGDGEYFRDYTHVTDVVDANLRAMTTPGIGHGEMFNIGAGHNHSVNELAVMLGGPTVFIPPRPGDPRTTLANNTKAREILGWEPKVTLEEGVRDLLDLHGFQERM